MSLKPKIGSWGLFKMLSNDTDIEAVFNNTGNGVSQDFEKIRRYRYWVLVATGIIGISGILGNIMMFVVAWKNEKMKTINNR